MAHIMAHITQGCQEIALARTLPHPVAIASPFLRSGLALLVGELPVVIALWHFIAWAGWQMAWLIFAVIYAVTRTSEFIGTHTGLVFGNYFYSATAIGPLLAEVPILLPLGYFAMD
jgi:uncharacterized membrane protein